jgi:hypothetical protein
MLHLAIKGGNAGKEDYLTKNQRDQVKDNTKF